MFLYKLKKILKEKFSEIFKASAFLSMIASLIPFAPFLLMHVDDLSFKEKRQMMFVSLICVVINLLMIHWVDSNFKFGIITTIFIGVGLSFLFFFIPCFIVMLCFEFSEINLDKSEIREAKIESLFRKLFW